MTLQSHLLDAFGYRIRVDHLALYVLTKVFGPDSLGACEPDVVKDYVGTWFGAVATDDTWPNQGVVN